MNKFLCFVFLGLLASASATDDVSPFSENLPDVNDVVPEPALVEVNPVEHVGVDAADVEDEEEHPEHMAADDATSGVDIIEASMASIVGDVANREKQNDPVKQLVVTPSDPVPAAKQTANHATDEENFVAAGSGDGKTDSAPPRRNNPPVKIDFQHYINDTPPPGSDVPPVPGTMNLQSGIDRYDGETGEMPVFKWTFKKYTNDLSNSNFVTEGRSSELWIDGERAMVPDQLYVNEVSRCQQASQANTQVITSSKEMASSQSKSMSAEYDGTAEVEGGYGPVSATKTMGNSMQYGSSKQSQEYEAASKRGMSRSAFTTIDADAFTMSVTDDSSLHPLFIQGVSKLEENVNDVTMSEFYNMFGTDYMSYAKMGGRCSIQTMATADSAKTTSNSALAKSSSMSMSNSFITVGKEKSSSSTGTTTTGTTTGIETGSILFEGGTPNGDWDEWCASVKKQPIALKFFTAPIYGLVARVLKKLDLAKALQQYLIIRQKQRDSCKEGQTWDKRQNKCAAGNCPVGSYKTKVGGEEVTLIQEISSVTTTNLAKGKPSWQSSTGHGGAASRAVYGNKNQVWGGTSCTHTNTETQPWWRVDLGQSTSVSSVKVWNRGDCCGKRLAGYQVRVGNGADLSGALCGTGTGASSSSVQCGGKAGRYVTVSIPGGGKVLTLCEVEVYGGAASAAAGSTHVCADGESKMCTCQGTVTYGRKFQSGKPGAGAAANLAQMKASAYKELDGVAGSVKCSNQDMGGDPLPGYYKQCLCTTVAPPKADGDGEICQACSPGQYLASPTSTSCTPCKAGTYSEKSAAICKQCGPGLTSPRSSPNCPYISGSYYILSGKCSLSIAKDSDVGDDSKDSDDIWAWWDCASTQNKVTIEHIEDNRFQIMAKGQYYLQWSDRGDSDKGNSKYWGIWSTKKSEVQLQLTSTNGDPKGYLKTNGDGTVGITQNRDGDDDKMCNGRRRQNNWKCPWASFKKSGSGDLLTFKNAMA